MRFLVRRLGRCVLPPLVFVGLIATLLAGCRDSSTSSAYGGSQNHLHDILALTGVPYTVLLATHIGLYRSSDGGHTWSEVAGGSGQPMDGLMIYKFAQSPVDVQRVYVLAVPRPDNPSAAKDTPGVYTSDDAGRTWSLAAAESSFPTKNLFTIGAGAASATQMFVIVSGLGDKGLLASDDAGKTWHQEPQLPITSPKGVQGDPLHPSRILLWSVTNGLYISEDAGTTWSKAPGIPGGVSSIWEAGSTIYVNSDSGLIVSSDDAAHFATVNSNVTYNQFVAVACSPSHAWAITGTSVFTTADGGAKWKQAASTSEHPTLITADPADPETAIVGYSYPLGVALTNDGGASWKQTLP
jgi:BNR/Asp-box repeat